MSHEGSGGSESGWINDLYGPPETAYQRGAFQWVLRDPDQAEADSLWTPERPLDELLRPLDLDVRFAWDNLLALRRNAHGVRWRALEHPDSPTMSWEEARARGLMGPEIPTQRRLDLR